MSHSAPDRRALLRQEGSDLSDTSTTFASPTISLPHQRHAYQRMTSQASEDFADRVPQYTSPVSAATVHFDAVDAADAEPRGLGISDRRNAIPRVPVGARRESIVAPAPAASANPFTPSPNKQPSPNPSPNSNSNSSAPNSSNPLLSPAWPRHGPASNFPYPDRLEPMWEASFDDVDIAKGKSAFAESIDVAFGESGDERSVRLKSMNNDNDDDDMKLIHSCPAKHDIHSSRKSWLSISILILSIYSTVFSGIWFMIALVQPRWGRSIHSGGSLSPDTASILFALFAKTIELSFVTVFVTFLGQVLSRRSLVKASRGVTIAELSMRTWVIQPGFMFTHFHHLKHVGMTVLGMITLTAALVAMFYTTASDALVSPTLKFGKAENKVMQGLVKASYANPDYIQKSCQTPITTVMDPLNAGTTCLDLEHAGEAYHNSQVFLETWSAIQKAGEGMSIELAQRPQAPGMLYDNTTVYGSWVATDTSNMTANFEKYSRVINNVTMAMPHAGVISAARDPKNGILQPEELAGVGEYNIAASVVSPAVNVLCVNMNATELKPIVYTEWPNAITNNSDVPGQKFAYPGYANDISAIMANGTQLNKTSVDEIFRWGYDEYGRYPPVFAMYPLDYNSITNISVYLSDSIYMLIKASSDLTSNYTVCQLRSYLNVNCSTHYNVSGITGGHLESHCEDPHDKMAYNNSVIPAPLNYEPDWRNVASEWSLALSLKTGISNANASTSRLLAQLIPVTPHLQSLMPSIAEHLAVLVGNTLLMSTTDATYLHFWNYTATELDPGNYEQFNASISTEEYASGISQKWQEMFYVVLLLVFLTNVFCLIYLFLYSGLVTDYTETQNLFALAVNSPPSTRLHGSCGAGPEGDQLKVDWHIEADDGSGHFFIKEGEKGNQKGPAFELRRRGSHNIKTMTSYSKLSTKRGSWL